MNFAALLKAGISSKALDGSEGIYRAPIEEKHIDANTDEAAIDAFLSEYSKSEATLRAYTKECRRLHIWAIVRKKKPISSLTREDYLEYIKFMKDPSDAWCGPRKRQDSEDWRPFTGPLSETAIILAMSAIDSMLSWWVDAGYLTGNPLGLIRQRREAARKESNKKVTRFLDDIMWQAFVDEIDALPEVEDFQKFDKARAHFLAALLVMLGPRAFEITSTVMGDFRNDGYGWFWHTVGKGSKVADVAMPDDMVAALRRWREFLGLSPYPLSSERTPALPPRTVLGKPRLKAKSGITPRRINQILKDLLEMAAKRIEKEYPDKAERMRLASAHWGRHTSITQKINAGMDRYLVQLDARHADQKTTQGYIHEEEIKRSREANKHRLRRTQQENDQGNLWPK